MEFICESELNLLGIHANTISRNPANTGFEDLTSLKSFLRSKEGQLLIDECEKKQISIEYEAHALQELLPRELFDEHPEYFRMDENGTRQKDHNMCFSSEGAYSEIEKNIVEIVRWLKPTTHRYFFWTDDVNNSYCHCELCKDYIGSEQTLLYENRLLNIIRKTDPLATLAHLAYGSTLTAPAKVKPLDRIFLEYAPIDRDLSKPIPEEHIRYLEDNLKIFPKNTAHVLEYWIDASKFSRWDRDSLVKIPWNKHDCERDVKLYSGMGIKSITTFATWMICSDYFNLYGQDSTLIVINEYGSILNKYLE
jgi:hypothetical protein